MPLTTSSADPIQQQYVEAWREIARHREGDWLRITANNVTLDLIVTSVHAGDEADLRQAYLTGRLLHMPVKVTVDAHNLAYGFYRLANLEKPAA